MKRLCNIFAKISTTLQKIELLLGTSALFILLTIMLLNAGGRYILNMPILWADEVNNYLFIWFGFLGCTYIMGNDGHMRVTAITDILPKTIKFIISQMMNLIMVIMFAIYVKATIGLLGKVTYSGLLRIPLKFIYFILPLSFAVMCFHIINNMIQEINRYHLERKGV